MGTLAEAQQVVPAELRSLRQWVVWRYVPREGEGKPTKVPYNVRTGAKAATDNPDTWCSFDEAQHARHLYDGIGFVFSPNDPFAGIDLDYCMDPMTGTLQPWARTIFEQCGPTYAE